jgi:hypothetical protein
MAHPPIKFGPADKRQLIARKIVPQADDSPAIGLAGSPMKAVLNGRADEIVELARSNLRR